MARFRLSVEYVGTRYRGCQVQKNARTVQGELNDAVREVSGRADFETYGSGRTDAGVHALDQVAHLDLETRLAPETLRRALNEALPADINVLAAEKVTRQFHARHGALARSYLYQISRRRTAFAKPFVWWLKDPLDAARMREAGALFEGMHDFRSFAEDDPRKGSTRVLVDRVEVAEDGELILGRLRASHFLWKMVPARVLTRASSGPARACRAVGSSSMTAGTLETVFERSRVAAKRGSGRSRSTPARARSPMKAPGRPVFSKAWLTTNRPVNSTRSSQSTSPSILRE